MQRSTDPQSWEFRVVKQDFKQILSPKSKDKKTSYTSKITKFDFKASAIPREIWVKSWKWVEYAEDVKIVERSFSLKIKVLSIK
jgi:hypothetical protein